MNSNTSNPSDNNNNTNTSRNPSHTEQYRNLVNLISARIQANQANIPPMPLSSSLPSSMASSLNNAANSSSAATAQIHAMQQIQQHQLLADKMDTSGPMSSTSTAVFVGDVISKLYPNVNQQETPLPRQWSVVHKQNTLKLTLGNLRVTYTGKLAVYAVYIKE